MNAQQGERVVGRIRGEILAFHQVRSRYSPPRRRKREEVITKEILLVHKDSGRRRLEQKANGSFWQGGEKIFSSEAEASQKGWKVDAVKVILMPANPKNPEITGPHERVGR